MKNTTGHTISMRAAFAQEIHKQMGKNKNIWLITNDLGYRMWDQIRKDYPDRFINVGAAEQALIGIGAGLAIEGKIPLVYSITTFLLYRPFETVRNYLHYDKLGVKLIASGRNRDYSHDGISHWAEEDRLIMLILSNIQSMWPEKNEELPGLIKKMLSDKKPWYINLRR